MPTKTKPKQPVDAYMIPIRLKDADRAELCELCGFDRATDADEAKAGAMFSALEWLLTIEFNRLRRVPDRPLPAHVVAALEPIAQKANELAALLDPGNLPLRVLAELEVSDVTNGGAWHLLTVIAVAAEIAIFRNKGQSSTGKHKQAQREAMELAKLTIGNLFDAHAIDPEECDKAAFLNICKKYLPKPPQGKAKT